MSKNKKTLLITILISIFLGSIIIFIGLFTYKKNEEIPQVDDSIISKNTILLAKSIIKTNRLNEIVDTRKINNKFENYFSNLLFEMNIFNIIRDSFNFVEENKIEISNFNQKIEYQISNDEKSIYSNVFFINKNNSSIFYKSHLKFYILTI